MAKLILLVSLIVTCGCSTIEKRKVLLSPIQTDMTAFNTTLRGELFRHEMKGDLSKLDSKSYRNFVLVRSDTSEQEYLELIANTDTQIALKAGKIHFAVCIKNASYKIVLCDVTNTNASTDFDSDDKTIDIESKVTEFQVN